MPGRVFNVRPGLIVGPGDPTHRFTYWPVRIREGGEILAPGNVDDPVQIIDARDLAEFIVHAALENLTGVYNAVGPAHGETIAGMLYGCRAVTKSDARFTWVPMTGVQELGLSPWGDLPVWTGGASMDRVNGSKAWNAGLTSRTMADIASATLESWDAMTPEERARPYGMSRERETEALAAWHAKK
jgi:2'-hydroxyisoflavone reductase